MDAVDFLDSIKNSYPSARVWGFLTYSGTTYAVVQDEDGIVAVRSSDKNEVHGELVITLRGHHFTKDIILGSIRKDERAIIQGFCGTYNKVMTISTSPVVHFFY